MNSQYIPQILLKSRDSQIQEIGKELSNIHSVVIKEIETIRNKFNGKSKEQRKEHLLTSSSSSTSQQSITGNDKESTVANKKLLLATSKMNKHFNDDYIATDVDADEDNSDDGIVDSEMMRKFIEENKRRISLDREGCGDHFMDIAKANSYNFSRDSSIDGKDKKPTNPPRNGTGDTPPSKDTMKSPNMRSATMDKIFDINEIFRFASK